MKHSEEMQFHSKVRKIEGRYEVVTDWGEIVINLDAIPNYAGGKGCPDEILVVKAKFAILGTNVELSIPVLIELEKGGYSAAEEDLNKFCERSMSGEQKSYLEIPMVIIGGNEYRKLETQEKRLAARVHITQVPKRIME